MDSNQQPTDYESAALTVVLRAQFITEWALNTTPTERLPDCEGSII